MSWTLVLYYHRCCIYRNCISLVDDLISFVGLIVEVLDFQRHLSFGPG